MASRYDAVFTYMNDAGPRVVRLEPGIVCTNTLHKLEFKPSTSEQAKYSALLSPISTFGQVAAEKIGRAYSGGVLKFELREARNLPIVISPSFNESLLSKVDGMLRNNDIVQAAQTVDEAFMPQLFGASWRDAQRTLIYELDTLRAARRKKGKDR
ncbi:hypothetical protein GCM10027318_04750 [Massilia agilis]